MHGILIVEDKEAMARMLRETLEAEGYAALTAKSVGEGIKALEGGGVDMVITDLKLPGGDGLDILNASVEENPLRPVIVMTAFGSIDTAVEAMKRGAYDFLTKPFDVDHLLMLIKRALENRRVVTENIVFKEKFSSSVGLPNIIGQSARMADIARQIEKAAPAKVTVLLLGESGTGKELFARAIHHLSGRRDYPIVTINCAAIPASLLESELFGYEKGAFSGAEARKLGKLELAQKGTVFLDEVGEMEGGLQAKLLRFLQEGEIERVGGTRTISLDVRIVAASNKNLEEEVRAGRFREDLFYRLNVFPIVLPPLRERTEDIPLLVGHFIQKYAAELNSGVAGITDEAMKYLMHRSWKGNVRELENTIERAIILCDSPLLDAAHVSQGSHDSGGVLRTIDMEGTLEDAARKAVAIVETDRIARALKATAGNKSRAAEQLNVSYKTLLTKIKEYGIE